MSNPNWGEVVTTTLEHRRKNISDTVSRNNIVISELRRRGRIRSIGGGRTITQPIMMGQENANFQWYVGREGLNIAGQEVLTSAEFPWKQYACGVSISGLEMLINDGEEQVIDMMMQRTKHAEKTIANQMHKSAHGNGTGSGGKEFGGMGLLISDTAGATVAGINSGTNTWWDNFRTATGAVSSATIANFMMALQLRIQRGTDKTNLIISDNTYWQAYWSSLIANQRFMNETLAKGGFTSVMFNEIPVVADGGNGGYAPVGMKFLNTETIELVMHKKRNNVVLSGPRRPLTEDSDTVIIAGMGNFIIENRMLNGVLLA